jgi:hypothetical protein
MNLFLTTEVIGRKNRYKKNVENEIGIKTVENYVSALVNYWRCQVDMKINGHLQHPVKGSVENTLKSLKRQTNDIRRRNNVDR